MVSYTGRLPLKEVPLSGFGQITLVEVSSSGPRGSRSGREKGATKVFKHGWALPPALTKFVASSLSTRLTAPGSPRMLKYIKR